MMVVMRRAVDALNDAEGRLQGLEARAGEDLVSIKPSEAERSSVLVRILVRHNFPRRWMVFVMSCGYMTPRGEDLVTFSHFLPRPELLPEKLLLCAFVLL